MNDGSRGVLFGGTLGILLGLAAFVAPGYAEEPTTTRVDFFDKSSTRTGSAIINEKSGRIDVFDTRSNRVGYGTIDRKSGRVDLYDNKSRRTGAGQIAPGTPRSTGGRR